MPADLLPRGVHELPLFAPPTVLVAVTHSHAFFFLVSSIAPVFAAVSTALGS